MSTLILACDHRNSLRGWLASLGMPRHEVDPAARRLKLACVRALEQAREELEPGESPMLLLDEEYGADAIAAATQSGLPVVIPAERSGTAEFLFEHDRVPPGGGSGRGSNPEQISKSTVEVSGGAGR